MFLHASEDTPQKINRQNMSMHIFPYNISIAIVIQVGKSPAFFTLNTPPHNIIREEKKIL